MNNQPHEDSGKKNGLKKNALMSVKNYTAAAFLKRHPNNAVEENSPQRNRCEQMAEKNITPFFFVHNNAPLEKNLPLLTLQKDNTDSLLALSIKNINFTLGEFDGASKDYL